MKKMRLFMLLSLLLVCLSSIASAHTWEWITSSDTTGYYYSRGSAVRLSDNRQAGESGHIKAWFKYQYEDENERQDKIRRVKQYIENGILEKKSGNLSDLYFMITQEEYKNVKGTIYYRELSTVIYDYAGNVIARGHHAANWDWGEIIPGSIGMREYEYALARAR